MNAKTLIDAWGANRWPEHAGKTFTLKAAMGNDGFCPTCDSPFAYVSVQANGQEIYELRDVQIHEVINEILASATTKPKSAT